MLGFVLRALWRKLWTLFFISIVSFGVIHLAPGQPSQIDPLNPRSILFQLNDHYGTMFLASVFLAGGFTASFYGWLPLYLPELFRTSVRATGQGFSFNFGRILAAVGALQTGNLMRLFQGGYPQACSAMSLIYLAGIALIWLAPETRGKPLPE